MKRLLLTLALVTGAPHPSPQDATITLNSTLKFQVMQGWEGAVLASINDYKSLTDAQLNAALDLAVTELGLTRARLAIRSGTEGGGAASFSPVNDNRNANVLDLTKFDFSALDYEIDRFIAPLRQKLKARGEAFYTGLQYVDHEANTRFEHWENPQEYAEFMLGVFTHMRDKYGFVPDGIDVVNEPDNFADWNPTRIGQAIVATAQKLQAKGFTVPEFIAPSNVRANAAVQWINGVLAVPGAAGLVKELSYHRYGGPTAADFQAVGAKAKQLGIRSSQLEFWGDFVTPNSGANYLNLYEDLTLANVSAWQQGVFVDGGGCVSQWVRIVKGAAEICPNSRLTRQYSRFVRPGAQRIGAASSARQFDPVAFVNRDGTHVVVVKAQGGSGDFMLAGLPAGTYGVYRANGNGSQQPETLPDVKIAAGQIVKLSLPYEGVLTVHTKAARPATKVTTPDATLRGTGRLISRRSIDYFAAALRRRDAATAPPKSPVPSSSRLAGSGTDGGGVPPPTVPTWLIFPTSIIKSLPKSFRSMTP
jgi:O-glycosyl hydrolase